MRHAVYRAALLALICTLTLTLGGWTTSSAPGATTAAHAAATAIGECGGNRSDILAQPGWLDLRNAAPARSECTSGASAAPIIRKRPADSATNTAGFGAPAALDGIRQ